MLLEQQVSISRGIVESREVHTHFMVLGSDSEPLTPTESCTLSDFGSLKFFSARSPHEKKP